MRKPNSAQRWVRGRTRQITEAGLDIDRARILRDSISESVELTAKWQPQLDRILSYLSATMPVHTPGGAPKLSGETAINNHPTESESVRIVMFRSQARGLGWLAVAALMCELVIAAMLAPSFFFGVPILLASIVALMMALCIAAASHGTFMAFLDVSSPLRQIRILRLIVNCSVITCCILIVPLLMSRIIVLPLPVLVLNLPLALLGLMLPVTAGACSALRNIYLRAWDKMAKRAEMIALALEVIKNARNRWQRELASIGTGDENQMDLGLDRRLA